MTATETETETETETAPPAEAALAPTAVPIHRLTVDRYLKMIEAGIFKENEPMLPVARKAGGEDDEREQACLRVS